MRHRVARERAQAAQQKSLRAFGALAGIRRLCKHFLEQRYLGRAEQVGKPDIGVGERAHLTTDEAVGRFRLEVDDDGPHWTCWPHGDGPGLDPGDPLAAVAWIDSLIRARRRTVVDAQ